MVYKTIKLKDFLNFFFWFCLKGCHVNIQSLFSQTFSFSFIYFVKMYTYWCYMNLFELKSFIFFKCIVNLNLNSSFCLLP